VESCKGQICEKPETTNEKDNWTAGTQEKSCIYFDQLQFLLRVIGDGKYFF
jgi:hypothetical protein